MTNFALIFAVLGVLNPVICQRDKSLDCECGKIQPHSALPPTVNNPPLGENFERSMVFFPWMAKVYLEGLHIQGVAGLEDNIFCSATIINDRVLLTAEHCGGFINRKYEGRRLMVEIFPETFMGAPALLHKLNDVNESIASKYRFLSPNIRIIILREPLQFNEKFRPVCLPEKSDSIEMVGKKAMMTGWGTYNTASKKRNFRGGETIFKRTFLEIISLNNCTEKGTICTRTLKPKNDSPRNDGEFGGPTTMYDENFKHTIVGVSNIIYSKDDEYNYGAEANVLEHLKDIDRYSFNAGAKYCKN